MVRFKNRYVVMEVVWRERSKADEALSEAALLALLRDALAANFGDYGLGSSLPSLQVKFFSPYTQLFVLRCSRDVYRKVLAAATMVTDIGHRAAFLRLLHVAGTVQACSEAAFRLNGLLAERLGLAAGRHAAAAAALHSKLQTLEH